MSGGTDIIESHRLEPEAKPPNLRRTRRPSHALPLRSAIEIVSDVPVGTTGDVSAGVPDVTVQRILVAAIEPSVRGRLRRVLASAGCHVDSAGDGAALLAAARRNPPDLIIADAASLLGDGVLGQLRSGHETGQLPVILLSADPGEAARQQAIDAGADDCLAMPFGARELLSRAGLLSAMARVGREASEAVRASERRFAGVLEAIGEAVYAIDRDERILFANRKALELWGRSANEVIGRPMLEVFPGIEDGEPYQAYRRVFATGEPAHIEATAPAMDDRWIGLDAYPGPEGGLVVAFRDIDERKRAEARLRESEERFRLMLEALPQAAFLIRADGEAEYYNRALRDYVGGRVGTSLAARTAIYHPDDLARLLALRTAEIAAGREYTVETRIRRHDGAYRWHRVHNRPIHYEGHIEYWLGTAVDIDDMHEANTLLERRVTERTAELEAANRRLAQQIDERERAEAQLRQAQRIEAVGQLTSGVAHDFNNLLTAIIGNLELLEARLDRSNDGIARPLAAATSAAERGARLTAQLLAFSRQQRMNPEPVDLNQIVGGVGGLLQSTIGATTRIETALAADLWQALADAGQIELVLLNLAINARDAMPDGGAITVTTGNVTVGQPERPEEPPPGEYVMVSVADTGTGIPADILDKVFDPFFTTKEVGKGSGLGLSQVLGVAQQLGGGVRIGTRMGAGTTVGVYLPRARSSDAPHRERGRGRKAAADHAGERILLVDDDSDVRAVAAAMLHEAGYDIVEAGSAGAALDHVEREGAAIRLLIADIVMPGMSGVELARAVRHRRPELPILFVTGFAGNALSPEDAAGSEVLRKPFRANELYARVTALLNHDGTRSGTPRLRRPAFSPR